MADVFISYTSSDDTARDHDTGIFVLESNRGACYYTFGTLGSQDQDVVLFGEPPYLAVEERPRLAFEIIELFTHSGPGKHINLRNSGEDKLFASEASETLVGIDESPLLRDSPEKRKSSADDNMLALTTQIVSAYVSHNQIPLSEISGVLQELLSLAKLLRLLQKASAYCKRGLKNVVAYEAFVREIANKRPISSLLKSPILHAGTPQGLARA